MKKIYFVVIGLISLGIFLLINASKDMSTYSSFEDAMNTTGEVKLVGTLAKDKDMIYKHGVRRQPNKGGLGHRCSSIRLKQK